MLPKLTLEWKKQARDDLFNIVDFISDDNPEAAQVLKSDIEAKTEKLREFPELYNVGRKRGTRELVAHKNYIVVYKVLTNSVQILRVKHVKRQWPSLKVPNPETQAAMVEADAITSGSRHDL